MEKLVAVLLLVSAAGAHAASFPFILNYVLRIDCGLTGKTTEHYNNLTWFPDSFFIDPGKTKQITSSPNVSQIMTTLRYFPHGEDMNCYRLQLTNTQKYIFRAGFYYGNYDGKSQPPVFDLSLGGQKWATVNSSATTDVPVFQELIYAPRNDNISVCLMGRKEYGSATPFISFLEATYLDEDETDINHSVYGMMRNGTAYHLVARLNFGGHDQVIEPWSGMADVCEERLNRYWTPQPMPGYTNLTFAAISCSGTAYDNRPPNSVINTAISPTSDSQSIYVPVNFPTTTPQSAYIVLYFYQNRIMDGPPENLNATRNMDVYIDGIMRRNVMLEGFRSGDVVTLYPVLVQGTMNVTISPANGTVLPPLLNGMEVYYATELAEEASTSNGDFKISCSFIMVGVCQLIVSVFLGLI